MKNLLMMSLFGLFLGAGSVAQAHTVTLNWTWPTTRQDGSSLALTAIGSITIYDTSIAAPGLPGTAITCNPGSLPPTTATGTCTTGTLTPGTHGFVVQVTDTSSVGGADSSAVSVTIPVSGPSAVSGLTATVN